MIQAQEKAKIQSQEVIRIETELASDKMQGQEIFTAGIDSASVFIEKELAKIGLAFYVDLKNMTKVIKSIAISSESIIKGIDTPARVKKLQGN